jgi:hypothetical protein
MVSTAGRRRAGASKLGCLIQLAILALLVFAGVQVGSVYLRFYRFQDAMKQQARFADNETNETILARLRATADTLQLPDEAHDVTVKRTKQDLFIGAEYSDTVDLRVYKRAIRFKPSVARTF